MIPATEVSMAGTIRRRQETGGGIAMAARRVESAPPDAQRRFRSSWLAERGHDLLGEHPHRLQHLGLGERAEREAAVEVIDVHRLLQPLELPDARVRRADH